MSGSSHIDQLVVARNAVAAVVRDLDAGVLDGAGAVALVDVFGAIERLGAAGKALVAARVADVEARLSGARSGADWLARRTGTSVGAARGALDAARQVAPGSRTDAAFRAGALSTAQAEVITAAVAADPSAEADLLSRAAVQPLQKLRDDCARVTAAASDVGVRHREIHRKRFFRTWTDGEGGRCGMYRATPEAAAAIERVVKPFADAAFDAARRAGEREPSEAYAFDGLLAMARAAAGGDGPSGGRRRRRRREGIVLVHLESLQRGSVERGEVCEIPGVGPVSVDVARNLLGDALLRLVITDGVDVQTVLHAGRVATDVQRTAIQVRQRGRCARPSCVGGIDEIDHTTGFTITGPVSVTDLAGLCSLDHLLKTDHGHRYQRTDHGWEWHRPDGVVERDHAPP